MTAFVISLWTSSGKFELIPIPMEVVGGKLMISMRVVQEEEICRDEETKSIDWNESLLTLRAASFYDSLSYLQIIGDISENINHRCENQSSVRTTNLGWRNRKPRLRSFSFFSNMIIDSFKNLEIRSRDKPCFESIDNSSFQEGSNYQDERVKILPALIINLDLMNEFEKAKDLYQNVSF